MPPKQVVYGDQPSRGGLRGHPSHDRTSLTSVDTGLKHKNKVQEATDAERLFAEEQYEECAQKCYEVLRGQPSEAIQAKAHMYLATEAVGPEEAASRAYHAAMAMQMWTTVLQRTGSSRFPVERASVQLAFTKHLFGKANALAQEEDPLPEEEEEEQEEQELPSY